ncbi:MAG: RNA polymerase sporulation sigma factor SigE [Ruminococcus sp.]|nr:RNA polymerase sporulation sigma factor SigE [Ruminococcus sp.]
MKIVYFKRNENRIIKFFRNCILKLKTKLGFTEQVHYINGSENLPAPLTKEEELKVMEKIVQGEEQYREKLIVHNLRLVVYIAKKFESTNINVEDLVSIGTIGLIKAVNTFSPERNIKLATYASRCIENEILMFLRKTSQQKHEVSIDEPLNTDWDGNELLLCDVLGSDPDIINRGIETKLEASLLLQAVSKLNKRECEIMELRFGLNGKKEHTQKQVADILGISQSYISRLEKKIIKRLRSELEKVV